MTRTVIRGGTIVDGTGAAPAQGDVVIQDGRIVEVGIGLDGDVAVDANGMSVLPGLMDCHTHVMLDRIDYLAMMQQPFSYSNFVAVRNLEKTLRLGITTIRDAGGADLGVKKAVDDGLIPGPRMQISISILSQTGGHGDHSFPNGSCVALVPCHPGRPENVVDGVEPMRQRVRELKHAGADVIKVCASGGVSSPRDDPRHPQFTVAELTAAVEEARATHTFVMAHAQSAIGIKNAITAGIRSIEHGIYLDDEGIEMMLAAGTFLVPTLWAPRALIEAVKNGAQVPPDVIAKAHAVLDIHFTNVSRAVAAGVKIAMGTDSGVGPHGDNLAELALMVETGLSTVESIKASTLTAAQLMGIDDHLGSLEPGKIADVVLVDGSTDTLTGLKERIRGVFKDGVQVY